VGPAHEALHDLGLRERPAEPFEDDAVDPDRDRLAVDQDAVAVEDDEVAGPPVLTNWR
jgi:hypothetical protein